jgi:hypothetical protein
VPARLHNTRTGMQDKWEWHGCLADSTMHTRLDLRSPFHGSGNVRESILFLVYTWCLPVGEARTSVTGLGCCPRVLRFRLPEPFRPFSVRFDDQRYGWFRSINLSRPSLRGAQHGGKACERSTVVHRHIHSAPPPAWSLEWRGAVSTGAGADQGVGLYVGRFGLHGRATGIQRS